VIPTAARWSGPIVYSQLAGTKASGTPRRKPERLPRRISDDLVIGHDGKPRCSWAGAGDTALSRYHDEVWGTRTYDEQAMFEALTLGVFEVGLSWSIVLGSGMRSRKHSEASTSPRWRR
jgi:hypothetical protein